MRDLVTPLPWGACNMMVYADHACKTSRRHSDCLQTRLGTDKDSYSNAIALKMPVWQQSAELSDTWNSWSKCAMRHYEETSRSTSEGKYHMLVLLICVKAKSIIPRNRQTHRSLYSWDDRTTRTIAGPRVKCIGSTNRASTLEKARPIANASCMQVWYGHGGVHGSAPSNVGLFAPSPVRPIGIRIGGFNQRHGEALPPQILLTLKFVVCRAKLQNDDVLLQWWNEHENNKNSSSV